MNRFLGAAVAVGLACSAGAIATAAVQNSEQAQNETTAGDTPQSEAAAREGTQPDSTPSLDAVPEVAPAPAREPVMQADPAPAPAPAPQSDPAPAAQSGGAPAPQADPAPGARPPVDRGPAACAAPFERADLTFADDRASEQRLRTLLAGKPDRVVLNPAAAFAPERPPARLQRWLAEVKGSGGEVSRTDISCTATRSLFKKLLTVAVDMASERLKSELSKPAVNRFAAAHGYDVIFWTRADTGQVQQIEFQRRGEEQAG